jgi:hypothetical protein
MTNDMMILEAIQRGYIEVDSESGLAYSIRFGGKRVGSTNKGGYRVFTLYMDGLKKQLKLHRLIWIAENGLPPVGSQIDHINRNKLDNRLVNLRLADAKLNAANRRSYNGASNPAAKIDYHIAEAIRKEHKKLKSYSRVAYKFNVSKSLVAQIVRGEIWLNNSSNY